MGASADRYHPHGDLARALVDAALLEIDEIGPTRLSLREVARRAGVSHAAPAHHFGDKAGLFTAIAVEGFRLLRDAARAAAVGDAALLRGGLAYVVFALTHRAHFEVMFRPDLLRPEDPTLVATRDEAFDVMFNSVEAAQGDPDGLAVLATAVAAWSLTHGFAVLWNSGNLPAALTDDPQALAAVVAHGIIELGEITRLQAPAALAHLDGVIPPRNAP